MTGPVGRWLTMPQFLAVLTPTIPERVPDFRVARHGSFHLVTALHERARVHLFEVSDPAFLRAVRFWQWPDTSTVIVYPDDVAGLVRLLQADGFEVLEVDV